MQNKLKKDSIIQNIILIIILISFFIYLGYVIMWSFKIEKIPEYIDKNKLSSLKIIISEEDLEKIQNDPEAEEYVSVDVIINGKEIKNCGFRTKGSTGYSTVKESTNPTRFGYRLELDYFVDNQTYDGISKFYINNGLLDKTYIKEMVAFDIYEKVGVKTPKRSLCELTINDKNDGIYTIVEVADDEFIKRTYGDLSGIIYKVKSGYNTTEDSFVYIDDNYESYPTITECDKFGKSFTSEDMQNFIKSLEMISKNENIEEYVDVDSVIDYFVASFFIRNDDSFISPSFRNFYVYQDGKKITLLPYDLNLYFRYKNSINTTVLHFDSYNDNPENKPLIYNILSNEIYQEQYKEKMIKLVNKIEEEDFLNSRIDVYANLIDEAAKNSNNFYTYEDFKIAIPTFKDVFERRKNSVKKQLEVGENYAYIEYEEEIGKDIYLIGGFSHT